VELNISMLWSKCKSHQTHYRSYRRQVCQSTEGRVQIRHLYSCYTQKWISQQNICNTDKNW